eukprot:scaffold15795_cov110-Isochrysis_galbana.AAC.7
MVRTDTPGARCPPRTGPTRPLPTLSRPAPAGKRSRGGGWAIHRGEGSAGVSPRACCCEREAHLHEAESLVGGRQVEEPRVSRHQSEGAQRPHGCA